MINDFKSPKIACLIFILTALMLSSCGVIDAGIDNKETAKQPQVNSQQGKESMLSDELEVTLNKVFKEANDNRYDMVTVEQLLLGLLENPSAAQLLRSSVAEFGPLRTDLIKLIETNTPLKKEDNRKSSPSPDFQRVLERSVFHVQSAKNKEVFGSDVLIAIFGEKDSLAVSVLNEQNITRLDVLNNRKE